MFDMKGMCERVLLINFIIIGGLSIRWWGVWNYWKCVFYIVLLFGFFCLMKLK